MGAGRFFDANISPTYFQVPIRSGLVGTHLMVEELGRQIYHGRVCDTVLVLRCGAIGGYIEMC